MKNNDKPEIFIGSDHAGFALKQHLVEYLEKNAYAIEDVGTHSETSCDYPEFAYKVCARVLDHPGSFGLLICGTGIGMSIAANRNAGVRAALCTHEYHAKATRAHNSANVLCLGSRITAPGLATEILEIFLTTPFEGGRHERRVGLLDKA